MNSIRRLALFAFGAACLLDTVAADRIRISTAISLKPAIEEVAAAFHVQHPSIEIEVHGGASGMLVQQLLRGAPADLVLTAGAIEMDRLERSERLVENTRQPFASNRLVVVSPPDGPRPTIVQDLVRPEFSLIAIGHPRSSPLGRYTSQALRKLDLEGELALRLVRGESARQVLEYVVRGEVNAGVVYASDARIAEGRVRVGPAFPEASHSPVTYEGAVVRSAESPDQALRFLRALASPVGQKILKRHGLLEPELRRE